MKTKCRAVGWWCLKCESFIKSKTWIPAKWMLKECTVPSDHQPHKARCDCLNGQKHWLRCYVDVPVKPRKES